MLEQRNCLTCNTPISMFDRNGRERKQSEYVKVQFCTKKCEYSVDRPLFSIPDRQCEVCDSVIPKIGENGFIGAGKYRQLHHCSSSCARVRRKKVKQAKEILEGVPVEYDMPKQSRISIAIDILPPFRWNETCDLIIYGRSAFINHLAEVSVRK